MLQSEHWGWPQAAASFAQAAMRQIEVVYAESNAPQSDEDKAHWTRQRHSRESMLCTNLFVYALEAGQYEVTPAQSCIAEAPVVMQPFNKGCGACIDIVI